jgi:hypothetical protein
MTPKQRKKIRKRERRYFKENSSWLLEQRRSNQLARKERNRAIIRAAKSVPCMDCGGSFHFASMDFDHRPGESKRREVSQLLDYSTDVVLAEIAKCEVVCANCHRVRSFLRGQIGALPHT